MSEVNNIGIGVGDTIYVKGEGNRMCRKKVIIAQTSRSWVIQEPNQPAWTREAWSLHHHSEKLPKNGKGYTLGTKRECELTVWAADNAYHIAEQVRGCRDHEVLLTIARLVGYEKLFVGETNETA